ncbi:MAG: hypothetical protein KY475_06070 [Planctomycetes bacterium]|nr:hypothetical protein [Planctomycetota bacterium]
MKHTLPSLIAALWTSAFALPLSAQTPQVAPPAGQSLLVQAAQSLYRQPALSAKVRQRVQMFGEELVGTGSYLQLGDAPEKMLRLELKLQLAGQTSSLTHVSNGAQLWIRREVPGAAMISYVDLQRVRREMAAARETPPADLGADWMVLGGLPALLRGLNENFQFAAARPAEFGGLGVWVIEGAWRPEALARLVPERESADAASLPPELPEQVQVVLGRDDLFPYQIEFRRSRPAPEAGEGRGWSPLLTLELFEVQFGAQLDPLQFQFNPGEQEVADHTELYLRKLGVERRIASGE